MDSSIKGVDSGGSKLHKSSNSSSKILLSILNVKLSSKSNKGFDIVTSKDLEIELELPKGSSDILGIGTGSLVGKLSISLGLKSISVSPIERVSICSPKGGRLKSLELFFGTLDSENKVLYKFDSKTISIATDYFSEANRILNYSDDMYKGRLPNDQDIAIVRPYYDIKNEHLMKEASILAQLEHENLFNLLGYCIEGMKVLLVYEFAPTASLDDLLYDSTCTLLDWNKRYKIILGVARVLVYLHKHAPLEIIHCNVQPGSVLLDKSLNPKLSGFMWARATNDTNCIDDDHCGGTYCTCGSEIMAPEYIRENILSNKVDVFSFGLLVLETISGRRTISCYGSKANRMLNYHIWRNWLKGTPSNIIDPRINVDSCSMTRFIEIGLLCIQEDAADRPTMEQVVDILLEKSYVALLIPKVPAWVISEYSNDTSSDDISSNDDDYDSVAVEEFALELGPR
ncbi:serine-threonine/tyrosine-protein kinase catalytic domain-containing protein [Artemisia annua]|uniref:non-specific serine/threonine protein kinase n=1 Tax=Artemisia annua TaxID=35608 RepID=A0A2U1NA06_ARTAN|nr:serine-threonine/tyrosine-protein kinase catalytic domain-containing protein [Artemisia annua]